MRMDHCRAKLLVGAYMCAVITLQAWGQSVQEGSSLLPVRYEELTAPDFVRAVAQSNGVCVIPVGILEKHGPQLPLGTDLLNCREVALRAAKLEYTVVFPQYYCGQIFEAKHQPGTIAYSHDLMWNMLQETCDELGRNGFTKIILVNGHGGNTHFLSYFCQAQMEGRRAYSVILFAPVADPAVEKRVKQLRKTTGEGHADEEETSMVMAHRPELAHPERGKEQSGENLKRLDSLPYAFTGIWWYARYPNHYAGDGSTGSREIGELLLTSESDQLVTLVKAAKKEKTLEELQRRFYDQSGKPLQTPQ